MAAEAEQKDPQDARANHRPANNPKNFIPVGHHNGVHDAEECIENERRTNSDADLIQGAAEIVVSKVRLQLCMPTGKGQGKAIETHGAGIFLIWHHIREFSLQFNIRRQLSLEKTPIAGFIGYQC